MSIVNGNINSDEINRKIDAHQSKYDAPHTSDPDIEQRLYRKYDHVYKVLKHPFDANLTDREKSELLSSLAMVLGTYFAINPLEFPRSEMNPVKIKPDHMLAMFVNTLSKINDQDMLKHIQYTRGNKDVRQRLADIIQTKYDVLGLLIKTCMWGEQPKFLPQMRAMRAQSPLATISDLYHLAIANKGDGQMRTRFADVETKLQELIKRETKKSLPDTALIEKSIADLRAFARYYGGDKLVEKIDQKYKIDEILDPNINTEYKSPMQEMQDQNKILMAQIAELKGKLRETQEGWRETTEKLKESQIEIQKLNAENETAKEELRDAQIEIQKQRAINEGANVKLSKEKERTQRLIDATEQLQIGIGSRGIKKMRETVEQIEHEMRKIER
ncbi:MAG: hypothetical protein R8M37_03305 [Alphaproteobacteria bacterium]|nr:hypothetical protein [Alphaproteobacteria bacterium]